jgi:hypothetical protein
MKNVIILTILISLMSVGFSQDVKKLSDFTTKGNWTQGDDGVLYLEPRKGESGWKRYDAYLFLKDEYENFECEFEYKHEKKGNSGFYFHIGDMKDPVGKGIEVQILDSFGKKKLGAHDCAAVIKGPAATKNACKPAGEWNKMIVKLVDKKLTVILNGETVQDNVDLTKTKVKDRGKKGYIAWQDHGLKFWLRNIKIKAL